MAAISMRIGWVLGRWWICLLLFAASLVIFTWIVPVAVSEVTAGRTLAPKILDEYYLTWTASDARALLAGLGEAGRRAYQNYYLRLDFWFPMLTLSLFCMSLLSLAFPSPSRLAWVNLLPLGMYVSDIAENLNHFAMAGSYPDLSDFSLTLGPWFSGAKYGLMTVLPLLAIAGFAARYLVPAFRPKATH